MKYAFLLLAVPFAVAANQGDISFIDLKVGSTNTQGVTYNSTSDALKGYTLSLEGTRLFEGSTSIDNLKLGTFGGLDYQETKDKKPHTDDQFLTRNLNLNAGGVLNLELVERVNLFTKAGLTYSFSNSKLRTSSEVKDHKENGLGYVIGAGARFLVFDHVTLGVEYNITQPTFEQENGHEYSQRSKTWFVTAGYKF